MSWMLRIASSLACGIIPLVATPLPRPYTVDSYDVSIRADLSQARLEGVAAIRFHSLADTPISVLELDAGGLKITSVVEGQDPQSIGRQGSVLIVALTNPLLVNENRTITVRYQAGAAPGLKFFPDQVFGSVTSDWMPCNNRPSERATLHLALTAPQGTKAAGSGQLVATRIAEGKATTEWRLDSATSPAWFGFALGDFAENKTEAEGVELRVLGAGTQVFDPTTAAIHYLAQRSGKHYPGRTYTQVFIHGDVSCSMAAGLQLLPESSAADLAKQPDALRLLAAGLAHQWYGLGVVSKDWSDLWLSEGISAFLADEFVGERLGRQAYERGIEHARQVYNQLRIQGKDRPLFYEEWTTRQEADGEIPTQKGACFLYVVHELMGEPAFADGMRQYTNGQWGQETTSQDFQRVFEAVNSGNPSTGRKKGAVAASNNNAKTLDNLFDQWVYGLPSVKTKKAK